MRQFDAAHTGDLGKPNRRGLVIWGASGHAKVVADIVRLDDRYTIVGFLDDFRQGSTSEFCGAPLLGGREVLPRLAGLGVATILIAVGEPHARLSLASTAASHALELGTAVHPRAVVAADVQVGPGTVVAGGAVVNASAQLGEASVVNTLASVDHDCILEEGATVCPGVHLGGNVVVKRCAWIGIGATVREKITIGESAVVGAGAVVVHDVPPRTLVVGVPARVVKTIDMPV
ncbi:MAG TPA: acetyltransferase [Pirellulales bacterium]|nr:acetyltransferase [Pirellulales bacterium]